MILRASRADASAVLLNHSWRDFRGLSPHDTTGDGLVDRIRRQPSPVIEAISVNARAMTGRVVPSHGRPHDKVGQTLTAPRIQRNRVLVAFGSEHSDVKAINRLQSIVGLVDLGIATVTRLSRQLRPATLDHCGLADAISWEALTMHGTDGHPLPGDRQSSADDAVDGTAHGAVSSWAGSFEQCGLPCTCHLDPYRHRGIRRDG